MPQANSLTKLRRLVELVASGVTTGPELQQGAELSARHLRYYLLAAETLSWVTTGAGSGLAVTARGRRLLTTLPGGSAEATAMADAITRAEAIRFTAGEFLSERRAGIDELAVRIAQRTGLSPSTARRRAACLTAWRSQLEDRDERPDDARGAAGTAGTPEPIAEPTPEPTPEPDPRIPKEKTGREPAPEPSPGIPGSLPGPAAPNSPVFETDFSPQPVLSEPPDTEHSSRKGNQVQEPSHTTKQKAGAAPFGEATLAPIILQPVPVLKYVTGDHAPIYRAIVEVFFFAKQRYAVELRPADVERGIARGGFHAPLTDDSRLDYHLDKLVEWGNLSAAHDTAAVSTIEDFNRRSFVYHLTTVGESAHRAVCEVEATVGRSGSLQANMLLEIRDGLRGLAGLAGQPVVDPEHTLRLLHALFNAFDTLTGEAARFIGEVSESFGADRIEEEQFVLRKQALVTYISRFVDHLRRLSAEIAAGARTVEASGVERLLAVAATSADLPPPLGDEDPREQWLATQRRRWAGVCGWFYATGSDEPTVERLAAIAVEAILGLTRALGRLNHQRTRPVDRRADFLTLAGWFGDCATDREAHTLFEAAFGLYTVRHFHIAEQDPDLAHPRESWWHTAPVRVPASLRNRGTLSRAGRPAAAPDHGAGRAWIAQRQQREREQLARAQQRFTKEGELRLSDLIEVSAAELDLLLALLDQALSSPLRADGSRRTRTSDGRLLVTLRQPAEPEAWIELRTPRGLLRCRDYRVEVSDGRTAAAEKAAS